MAIKTLAVDLALNANPFKAGLKDAEGAAGSFGDSIKKALGPNVTTGMMALSAGFLAGAAAAAVLGKAVADLGAKAEGISNLSKKTGLAVESIQQLSRMAQNAGGSFEGIAGSMKFLQKNIAEGDKAFAALGLRIADLNRMKPEEQLQATARAINDLQSPTERTAAAMAVFGRAGADMLPIMDQLAKGSSDLAVSLSEDQIEALAGLDDQLDAVKGSMSDAKDQFLAALAASPAVTGALQAIAESVRGIAEALRDVAPLIQSFVSSVLNGIGGAGAKVAAFVDELKRGHGLSAAAAAAAGTTFTLAAPKGATPKPQKPAGSFTMPTVTAAAEAEREKRAKALLDITKDYNKALQSIVSGPLDTMEDQYAGLDAMSEELLKNSEKTAKETLDALKGTRLRSGDLIPSIGGKGLWTKDPDVIKDALADAAKGANEAASATASAAKEAAVWQGALQGVALLAGTVGGAFGEVLQVVGNIGESFKGFSSMSGMGKFNAIAGGVGQIGGLIGQKKKKTGGALQGAASGAMTGAALGSILPGIGTVAGGIIGGVAGGVMGWLGGRKKEKAEKAQKAEDFKQLTAAMEQQYGSLAKLEEVAGKYGVSLKKALASKDAEKLNKELAELQKRQAGLASAGQGIVALVQAFKPATEAGAMAQAGLFSSVFWATVQREGLANAANTLRPAFDTLMATASESMKALLAPVGQQMSLAANEAFRGASEGASALGQTIHGMMDAGIVSIGDMRNAGVVAMEQYNAALGAAQAEGLSGAAAQEAAVRAIGPAITELLAGYASLGIPLDDNAMALKAAADATGMMFPEDKMAKAAEAMERVASALERAFGFSSGIADNASRTRFPDMPNYGGGGGGGGEALPEGGGAPPPPMDEFAEGGVINYPASGKAAMLHGREAIIPLDKLASFTGSRGEVSAVQNVTINVDGTTSPEQIVEAIERALQMQQGRLADEIRRATGME